MLASRMPNHSDAPNETIPEHLRRDGRTAGLCAVCQHARRVENDRGSVFFRCDYARIDPAYPKYPVLPVVRCAAFARST